MVTKKKLKEEDTAAASAPAPKRRRQSSVMVKPKNAIGGFFLYAQDNLQSVRDAFPGDDKFGEHARILAHQYKQLSDRDVVKWEKKASQHYSEELKQNKKRKKDPNAPKRNMSAYMFFSTGMRPTVKKAHPEASFGEIAKLLSAQFKTLTAKERKVWDGKALADKHRYERASKEYKQQQEKGGGGEEEEDNEDDAEEEAEAQSADV